MGIKYVWSNNRIYVYTGIDPEVESKILGEARKYFFSFHRVTS